MSCLKENIKVIRTLLGLTQGDFASLMDVKRTTLANYESGGNDPSLSFVEKLCTITGIEFKSLLHVPIEEYRWQSIRRMVAKYTSNRAEK